MKGTKVLAKDPKLSNDEQVANRFIDVLTVALAKPRNRIRDLEERLAAMERKYGELEQKMLDVEFKRMLS